MFIKNPFGKNAKDIKIDDSINVYSMNAPARIENAKQAIKESLEKPIASKSLKEIADEKLLKNKSAKAAIVISDNTRPVPYKGDSGILLPIVDTLLSSGYDKKNIVILVATGTHKPMTDKELRNIIDEKIFEYGISVINHDCKDESTLIYIGKTKRGSQIKINKYYMEADLKILTGLVESHFMAGFSGGRKSVCPGLIGEEGTYVFHSAEMMAHKKSADLILEENPVHDESLEVAIMAGVDFIVNVTLDHAFDITGIFSGDLKEAHKKACEKVKTYASIEVKGEADIVITHSGFVGINHYQCAKCGFASIGALKKNGWLVVLGDFTDVKDNIGSLAYKTVLQLLTLIGVDNFIKVITSKDWTFIPEQWQVQKWASLFDKMPIEHLIYFAPQLDERDAKILPGKMANTLLNKKDNYTIDDFEEVIKKSIEYIKSVEKRDNLTITYLSDGPYAIPYVKK